ncbi:hypothetical protein [Limnobacter litoralis]|uniref:Phage abortive infection protein n=1 Tax=Limnobacter litoralis TaxID=481366 RepID=A0ABQ5YSU3_9BURK|nr:hypothetical protein [Limnobacter litoralis]GLR26497.1 hypothetical protein GCM10007875_15870 [Limnobacter litoralis]
MGKGDIKLSRFIVFLGWPKDLIIFGVAFGFGLYFTQFHGPLSDNPGDWANFGSYIGGITAPIVGALTVYILLITVDLQHFIHKNQQEWNEQVLKKQQEYEFQIEMEKRLFRVLDRLLELVKLAGQNGPASAFNELQFIHLLSESPSSPNLLDIQVIKVVERYNRILPELVPLWSGVYFFLDQLSTHESENVKKAGFLLEKQVSFYVTKGMAQALDHLHWQCAETEESYYRFYQMLNTTKRPVRDVSQSNGQ